MPAECWTCGNACIKYDKFCCAACEAAFDDSAFKLKQPKRERKKLDVENVKCVQKPLFLGAGDLPGQSYLFE